MDIVARGRTLSHQSRAGKRWTSFHAIEEVGLLAFVCERPAETGKSESNQAGCDHGLTGIAESHVGAIAGP
jgi:hypothetical protein